MWEDLDEDDYADSAPIAATPTLTWGEGWYCEPVVESNWERLLRTVVIPGLRDRLLRPNPLFDMMRKAAADE